MTKKESKTEKNLLGKIWETISGSSDCCTPGETCCAPTGETQKESSANMVTLTIYDPPMCCSSGVCGQTVNSTLVEFAGTLKTLRKHGVSVKRWNLAQQPQAFVENPKVNELIVELGKDGLPFIFVNNEFKTSGRYPTSSELFEMLGVDPKADNDGTPSKNGCC